MKKKVLCIIPARGGSKSASIADFQRDAPHPSTLGRIADDGDDVLCDTEFVHELPPLADSRQLLADQHIDDPPTTEFCPHGDATCFTIADFANDAGAGTERMRLHRG